MIARSKLKKLILSTVSVVALSTISSHASAANIDEIELQLNKALKIIEAQSQQLKKLSKEVKSIKKASNRSGGGAISEIKERLDEVENVAYDLEDKIGSRAVVNAFDAKKFDIGGFVHTTFTHIDAEAADASAWDTQNFELLIKANLDDQWSAFFAGGFLREEADGVILDATKTVPSFAIANKSPQIIGWVNYKHNDLFNIQLGRMINPHGIVNIEHFPQILLDPRQPQFLRPFSGDTIFPNFVTGAQVHGKHFLRGDNFLEYNAYTATHQGDPEVPLWGGRVAGTHGASGITLGLNGARGKRGDSENNTDYSMYGADLLIDHKWLLWKNEFFRTSEDQAGRKSRIGWYSQPAWRITDRWTAFYRYDYLDDGNDGNGEETVENVFGLTFKPKPFVHLRASYTLKDFEKGGTVLEDQDANIINLSTTFSF